MTALMHVQENDKAHCILLMPLSSLWTENPDDAYAGAAVSQASESTPERRPIRPSILSTDYYDSHER